MIIKMRRKANINKRELRRLEDKNKDSIQLVCVESSIVIPIR